MLVGFSNVANIYVSGMHGTAKSGVGREESGFGQGFLSHSNTLQKAQLCSVSSLWVTDCCPHHGKCTLSFTNICLFLLDRKGILMALCILLGTTNVKHQLSLRYPTLDVVPHRV